MNELDLWLLSTAPELVKQAAGPMMEAPELGAGYVRRGEAEGRHWGRNLGTVAGTALGAALARRSPTAGGVIARLAPSVVGGNIGGGALGATLGEHKARKDVAARMQGEEGQAYLRERDALQQARRDMLSGEGTANDVGAQRKRFQAARALAQEALAKESAEKTGQYYSAEPVSPVQLTQYEQARAHGIAGVGARQRKAGKGLILGGLGGGAVGALKGGRLGAVAGLIGGGLAGKAALSRLPTKPTERDIQRAEGRERIRKAQELYRSGSIGRLQRQATIQDVKGQR